MTDPKSPPLVVEAPRKTDSPATVWVPGAVLLFLGLWIVTDRGPLLVGWASFALGVAMTLIGTVAAGVAWGLQLHEDRHA